MSAYAHAGPPFRADHVGSLLRPAALREARKAHLEGRLGADALRPIEDRCIREAVEMQEAAGLQSVTDGEFRRTAWRDGFMNALEGFSAERTEASFKFRKESGEARPARSVPEVVGKLRRTKGVATTEFRFLRGATRRTPKLTLPSPSNLHFFGGDAAIDRTVYPDIEEFFADVATAYREELAELAELGCTYVQLDEVPLAVLCDETTREILHARGEDPTDTIDRYVRAINGALAERPAGMTVALHLCRGNASDGSWMASGGYEIVAERLFNEIAVDAYFLEYDTERAGDFAPLRHVPADKTVALGLISTKTPVLETADGLKRRLDEASKLVPYDRLCLCPQCGFASGFGAETMTADQERAKLDLLVGVAAEVWRT